MRERLQLSQNLHLRVEKKVEQRKYRETWNMPVPVFSFVE